VVIIARCGCGSTAVCTCLVTGGTNVTVTGNGSTGSPYVVNANLVIDCDDVRPCLSAGPGIIYNAATGVISADAGVEPTVTALDTASVNTTVTGGPAFVVSADVIADPNGLVTITPQGVSVTCASVIGCLDAGCGIIFANGTISADVSSTAGNALICDANGLFVPTGTATVNVACGITGDGSIGLPLTANTGGAVWPYACPEAANGGPIYCGGDGVLRTAPIVMVDVAPVASSNVTDPGQPAPAVLTTIETTAAPFANPSACSPMMRVTEVEFDVDFNIPVGATVVMAIQGDDMYRFTNTGTVAMIDHHVQVTKTFPVNDAAGAATLGAFNLGISGSAGVTYDRVQWFVRHAAVTSQEV
jgi:hypothetical protein